MREYEIRGLVEIERRQAMQKAKLRARAYKIVVGLVEIESLGYEEGGHGGAQRDRMADELAEIITGKPMDAGA